MKFSSPVIDQAVAAFKTLPGIGEKTALRLVLHLLNNDPDDVKRFLTSIGKLITDIQFCKRCHNISSNDLCNICVDIQRNQKQVCVVENIRELMAIENTGQYQGTYHILGGLISPVDGIGPEQLNIDSLINRAREFDIQEIIMALNPTMEGDTTIFYISKRLKGLAIKLTTLARGVAFGGELEYVDDLTLARSLMARLPYDNYLSNQK